MVAEVFHSVLTSSLHAAVVGLVILLLKAALKNRLNAQWHYLIWIVLILKLIMPFGPASAVSLFNIIPEVNPPERMIVDTYQVPAPIAAPPVTADKSTEIQPAPVVFPAEQVTPGIEEVLAWIWILGMSLMLFWLVGTCYSLNRNLSGGCREPDARIAAIFESCKSRMGVGSNLTPVVQEVVGTPSLFGILRSRVLLTPEVERLNDDEIRYVLLHEMAHYKRKDVLVNYLLVLLQVIHWFNPVIWYCFQRIREDMEAATDQYVLSVLDSSEYRSYGRALLTVLEGFTSANFAPRLLGMVDDQSNMARRLKMIKMAEFFQGQRKAITAMGVLCLLMLGGLLLTSALDKNPASGSISYYDAEGLLEHRTPYVGNNSRVVNIINLLPLSTWRQEVSLQTKNTPYGITVNYDFRETELTGEQVKGTFHSNAVVMFALIENVDLITFTSQFPGGATETVAFARSEAQQEFPLKLWEYSKDISTFKAFLNQLDFKIFVFPQKYSPAMSSTPGIRILAERMGRGATVSYSAQNGVLFTGDDTGLTKGVRSVRVPYGSIVYWSPIGPDGQAATERSTVVHVAILDEKGKKLNTKEVLIVYQGAGFYQVAESLGIVFGFRSNPIHLTDNLDEAVANAIKQQSEGYKDGEFVGEGHIILSVQEGTETVKVYTIASLGVFGFENGIFTKVSGSGAIPTVLTFYRDRQGRYTLIKYQEPLDGAGYAESVREMFPLHLQTRVLSPHNDYAELKKQQEAQAREYLRSIGRSAEVSVDHVEKKLADINVEASNKLFSEYAKFDSFLNNCPYWLGTREMIENGERFIYETAMSKTSDGYDLIIFRKTGANGEVGEERHYKIVGSEPRLIKE
jgi:bla regulator protein BlaR1